jgi:tetratricopeptide (TPR) repeat protein
LDYQSPEQGGFVTRFAYLIAAAAIVQPAAVYAGETVLYGPAPAWVSHSTLPDPAHQAADAPVLLLYDNQQRIDGDTLSAYLDTASRAATPELLSQMATLSLMWLPDKGDVTIHELSIQRGSEHIDLLAKGQKFTVLRREETMEQRELTGLLTATMPVEGLRIGDVLRLTYSTSTRDPALGGHVQNVLPIPTEPVRLGAGRVRLSWAKGTQPHWKILAGNIAAQPQKPGATELDIALPAPKLADMPADAPVRFRPLPLLELSTFASWQDVSRAMAPLYATDGLIAPGSPLAAEVAAIMKAEPTPVGRAQRALRLVQDQVRYLAVLMNGGNYTPQAPARTWELRYGDCKAKSLLLLAMLRAMGIEGEAVLASSQLGDWVTERLPSAAAFDHVLVRAVIDGRSAWLDGTRTGSRLPDIWDTPALRTVLPLRAGGAELMPVALHNDARPLIDISVDADESASVDLPEATTVSATFRGDVAGKLALANQLTAKQRLDGARAVLSPFIGEAQLSDIAFSYDDAAGTATVTARAATTTPWRTSDRRMRRDLMKLLSTIDFSPDRGRPAWAAIPVAVDGPVAMRWRMRVRLPDGGRGMVLEGERNLTAHAAGYDFQRSVDMANGVVTVEERVDQTGREVAAADIAKERDALAGIQARSPRLLAPTDTRRYWDVAGGDPAGATQVKALEAVFGKAIAADQDEVTGYTSRANFRRGIGNRAGALADYTKALALAPTVDLYLARAWLQESASDLGAALADAEAARKLDPSSVGANVAVARLKAERGDLAGALALLNEREAVGGEARAQYRRAKADVLGEFGDPKEAIGILDTAIAEKPGSPSLLNARCWVKGTRAVMLDTAIKDCTTAVELSDVSSAPLDSRAVVWFRLARYDDALRDLDAALAESPGQAASLFMRGIVLAKLDRLDDSRKDLALARRLYPRIDEEYARFGLKP